MRARPGAAVPPDPAAIEVLPPPPATSVSRETRGALETYRRLLEKWQARTNLVGPGTLDRFWDRHVDDSLQLLDLAPKACKWVDLGSGAGFPGMVIAIARSDADGDRHVLVEANARKCAFLREVARATGARVEIVHARIESAAERLAAEVAPDVVTARALAPLADLLGYLRPFLAAGARAFIHKGRDWRREIAECGGLESLDLVVHGSRVEAGSVVLEIRLERAAAGARSS
jgi:16S rRNA (guanine527-N7)-methyltransferase